MAIALAAAAAGLATAVAPTEAGAQATGGVVNPGDPEIKDVRCLTLCIKPRVATVGSKIRINGAELDQTRVVSLERKDGRRAKDTHPRVRHQAAVVAFVKKGAKSSPVKIADAYGQVRVSPVTLKIGTKEQLIKVQKRYIFPVRGKHYYGDGLGAGRGHEGQDVMAACGTPLVAAHTGKVINRSGGGPSGAAGNFVMIWDGKTSTTHVYMHLIKPPRVGKGQMVSTGTRIGAVGSTGRSTACHLHFEVRKGKKGWLGTPVNPTKPLKYWDSYS